MVGKTLDADPLDLDDIANEASLTPILDDLLGREDMEQYNALYALGQRWISEIDYTNGDLSSALASASEGWELAKGTYQWPEEILVGAP